MFFCEKCRDERNWPGIIPMSNGPCEICKTVGPCFDIPSRLLPLPNPNDGPTPTEAHLDETPEMGFDSHGEPVPVDADHLTVAEKKSWLKECGWRQGRDGLWRNDTYGGSFKLENAAEQQLRRPVGDPESAKAPPRHFVVVAYEGGETHGCWVGGKTPAESVSKFLGRKAYRNSSKKIKWVRVSDTADIFEELVLSFEDIIKKLRGEA